MGKNDRNKIHTGMPGMGRGFAPTLDDIAALKARLRLSEKGAQPAPKRPFATYLQQEAFGDVADERPPQQQQQEHGQEQDEPDFRDKLSHEGREQEFAMSAGRAAKLAHTASALGKELVSRLPKSQRTQPARPTSLSRAEKEHGAALSGHAGKTKIRG